jgi:hypothetical protein
MDPYADPADKLLSQAHGMIETCKTMIASPRKESLPGGPIHVQARAIITEARRLSDDPILTSVDLSGPCEWADILGAMQSVVAALG